MEYPRYSKVKHVPIDVEDIGKAIGFFRKMINIHVRPNHESERISAWGSQGDDSYWLVVGMIVTTPLKKITDFVNWDEIPNIYMGKYKIHGNQTTN